MCMVSRSRLLHCEFEMVKVCIIIYAASQERNKRSGWEFEKNRKDNLHVDEEKNSAIERIRRKKTNFIFDIRGIYRYYIGTITGLNYTIFFFSFFFS